MPYFRAAHQVRAAGGEVYAISSEPQALADRAVSDEYLPFERDAKTKKRGLWRGRFVAHALDHQAVGRIEQGEVHPELVESLRVPGMREKR